MLAFPKSKLKEYSNMYTKHKFTNMLNCSPMFALNH